MKGRFVAVVAAAGILALSGCSSGSAEQPGDASSSPPVVTGPPSIVAPTPVPPTRPTAEASTSSVQAYCQTVQGYQKEATEAINQLLKQPQSVQANLARLQSARDQLEVAQRTAPASVQKSVGEQVATLDEVVAQARAGDVQSIDVRKYTQAVEEFVAQCDLGS